MQYDILKKLSLIEVILKENAENREKLFLLLESLCYKEIGLKNAANQQKIKASCEEVKNTPQYKIGLEFKRNKLYAISKTINYVNSFDIKNIVDISADDYLNKEKAKRYKSHFNYIIGNEIILRRKKLNSISLLFIFVKSYIKYKFGQS